MGMFDSIEVSDALPTNAEMDELGLNKRDWTLQTKDWDCALDVFVLQDGVLHEKRYRVEQWVEGDPKGKSLMDRIGHLHRDGMYLQTLPITDTIRAYDFRQNVGQWDCWCEWRMQFKDGVLTHIELIKFEKTDNTERKERETELFEQIKINSAKWYNRYIFHTRAYCWFSGRARWFLYRLADKIQGLGRFF